MLSSCKRTKPFSGGLPALLACFFLILGACGPATSASPRDTAAPPTAVSTHLRGLVLDLDGKPVAGATVSTRTAGGSTGADGWFELDTGGVGAWVTVRHPAFISRTRAVRPGNPGLFRLTPQDGKTVALLFTGDVMFGRRFFDPNEDGDLSDGLLPENPTLQDHLKLIDPLRPLLENADLTVINFESVVSDDPSLNYLQARPAEYHAEKDYVYSSHPSALLALKQVGVDVVDMGNNHVYDLLDKGVLQTQSALEAAGFLQGKNFFGFGSSEIDAWLPAMLNAGDQKLGFTGCTTDTQGKNGGASYVADDAAGKGGAARCTKKDLARTTDNLVKLGYTPVVILHGGIEYNPQQSDTMAQDSKAAHDAGAPLVISHHTHVISGLAWDGQSKFTALSLGNFIIDQTLWPTYESMVLVVHLREGRVIHAYTEPLIIEDYIPTGVTGADADYVARIIAGYSNAGFVMEDGSIESDFTRQAIPRFSTLELKGEKGALHAVPAGEWISSFGGDGTVRLGRDLLRVGDFEDDNIDAKAGENSFWTLSTPASRTGAAYAYQGENGAHLERGAGNLEPAVLTTIHRILVNAGDEITATGMGRMPQAGSAELQLSWFSDTKGPSTSQTIIPLKLGKDWTAFSLDATVPDGVVAVGLYLKLQPPQTGQAAVDFDALRLIKWAPQSTRFNPLYNYFRVQGSGVATFERDVLPGWDLFQPSAVK